MNTKKADHLVRMQLFQEEDEKPSKFNELLRQTMSVKSTKAFSEKFNSDLTNSNDITIRKDDTFKTLRSQ
jgi:hypothetical protein